MKNLFLAISVIGLVSLTSCKSEEKKVEDATANVTEQAAETGAANVEATTDAQVAAADMPTFSNPEVQKFAEEYKAYFQEMVDASKAGDATKLQELTAKGVEFQKRAADFTQKMTTEESQKWVSWTNSLRDAVK